MLSVGPAFRKEAIQLFINMCQYQHLIAFSQWRYIYHPDNVAKLKRYELQDKFFKENEKFLMALHRDDATVSLYFKINLIFLEPKHSQILTSSKNQEMVDAFVKAVEFLMKEEHRQYSLGTDDVKIDLKDLLICDFDQLRTPDPFEPLFAGGGPNAEVPLEQRLSSASLHRLTKLKKQLQRIGMDSLVYPVYKYLDPDVPPSLMFIPSKVMLYKVMMIAWLYDQASEKKDNAEGSFGAPLSF